MVIVKLGKNPATGADGWVSFYNAAGSVNVIVDVGGFYGAPRPKPGAAGIRAFSLQASPSPVENTLYVTSDGGLGWIQRTLPSY